jgi:asparagine N-glycosylation enzyme membrane subunit Stt3
MVNMNLFSGGFILNTGGNDLFICTAGMLSTSIIAIICARMGWWMVSLLWSGRFLFGLVKYALFGGWCDLNGMINANPTWGYVFIGVLLLMNLVAVGLIPLGNRADDLIIRTWHTE